MNILYIVGRCSLVLVGTCKLNPGTLLIISELLGTASWSTWWNSVEGSCKCSIIYSTVEYAAVNVLNLSPAKLCLYICKQ